MKLFRFYNGFIGETAVSVLIVAVDEDRAAQLARVTFATSPMAHGRAEFSLRLECEMLRDDLTSEWSGQVED